MESADLSLNETSDGLQVIYGGRSIYGERPLTAARRRAASVTLQSQTLYLLTSPVAWHGVAEILGRLPRTSRIIAVEADPVLLELSRRLIPTSCRNAGIAVLATTESAVNSHLGPGGAGRYRRVREISLCRASAMNRKAYRALIDRLERQIRNSWQNRITLSAMGRLWVGNLFRNLPSVCNAAPLPALRQPAIVCGAGPSLARALPLIRALRTAVAVIAVDTALPTLAASGLSPDYVIAIEGQIANIYDFLPVSNRSYTLIADLTSSPAVVGLHEADRIVWICSEFAPLGLLERLAAARLPIRMIPPLGSVGVAAVHVAAAITGGPILITGLDFAFRPAPADPLICGTHAPGSPQQLARDISRCRLSTAPPPELSLPWLNRRGVDGGKVLTTLTMVGYAEQLARVIADARQDVAVIEPFGLETGARATSIEEARALVEDATTRGNDPGDRISTSVASGIGNDTGAVSGIPSPATETAERVRRFLLDEQQRLGVLAGVLESEVAAADRDSTNLSSAAGGGVSSEEAGDLDAAFADCSYVAVDFPDFAAAAEDLANDHGALRRLQVATDYYADRILQALMVLRS